MKDLYRNAEFVLSAFSNKDFKSDKPIVVFAGRSNVGKSSVINSVLRRNDLARTGNTPGKTIGVNYYNINDSLYFVDLPGYGYAKRSYAQRESWAALINSFFSYTVENCQKRLGILIVDARHTPQELDLKMADFYSTNATEFLVIGNKIDKLKKSELKDLDSMFQKAFNIPKDNFILYSAKTHTGRHDLRMEISKRLNL